MQIDIKSDDQWKELRAANVGGSEVAALFNACSYLTHLELYLVKRGEVPAEIEDNERMLWGRLVEDAIAQGVSHQWGWKIINLKAYFTCDDTQGMGCTPDRIIMDDPRGPGLLQIKNVDRIIFAKWEDGQPPLQYQLQLQHELACTGYAWGAVAVLVGGNQLEVFEYNAHPVAIAKIKTAISKFWNCVRTGVGQPPAVDADYEILKDLYPSQTGKFIDLSTDNELPDLCARSLAAAERRKEAEKEEKQAKAEILQKIGDAEYAICSGFAMKRTTVSKKEYVVKATTYSQLTIKLEKEQAA